MPSEVEFAAAESLLVEFEFASVPKGANADTEFQMGCTMPVAGSYANTWLLCASVSVLEAFADLSAQGSIVSGAGAGGFGSNVAQ